MQQQHPGAMLQPPPVSVLSPARTVSSAPSARKFDRVNTCRTSRTMRADRLKVYMWCGLEIDTKNATAKILVAKYIRHKKASVSGHINQLAALTQPQFHRP